MNETHRLDIAGLQLAYVAGKAKPSEVVDHYLARIDTLDTALGAYVEIDRAGARAGAEESDRRVAAGAPRALEGVPVAVKANIAVKGLEWNAGMEARRGIIAEADAECVARLRAAGAIILGTLNMHEAALGATTDNIWFGRTMNPHRQGYTPGGSSGGSGAAVAAGLCVASLGTDTMGSVRIPAAYNGVYAIKPTHDSIPDRGLVPVSERLDSIGPIARSLGDLELLLAQLGDAAEPAPMPTRLLLLESFDGVDCQPAVVAAYDKALSLLADMQRSTLALVDDAAAIRFAGFVVAARELIEHLGPTRGEAADKLSGELVFMLDYADGRSADDVVRAEAILTRTRTAVREALGSDGVLLMPTAPQAAFAHSSRPPVNQSAFTALANIAGLPAISIPADTDAAGLPVAVQLVGPENSDAALLALARNLDAALAGFVLSPLM